MEIILINLSYLHGHAQFQQPIYKVVYSIWSNNTVTMTDM